LEQRRTVLLVDDDIDFIAINKSILQRAGYRVITASSGEEGLAMAVAERPDLVVLDVMMEEATEGFDLARRLRANPDLEGIRIALLTSINRQFRPLSFAPDPSWLPVDLFLEKPLAPEDLLRRVEDIIGLPGEG
jgi:CheY-like chemotaxis protein